MTVNYRVEEAASSLFRIDGGTPLRGSTNNAILGFYPEDPPQGLFPTLLYEAFHKGLGIGFQHGIDLL